MASEESKSVEEMQKYSARWRKEKGQEHLSQACTQLLWVTVRGWSGHGKRKWYPTWYSLCVKTPLKLWSISSISLIRAWRIRILSEYLTSESHLGSIQLELTQFNMKGWLNQIFIVCHLRILTTPTSRITDSQEPGSDIVCPCGDKQRLVCSV